MKSKDIAAFCRESGIDLLVLFGSRASGGDRSGSDRDIAVKLRKGREMQKLDLIARLTDYFEDAEIDLVILTRDTDPLLLREIFYYGRLLYEAAPDLFEKEKLRAWKLYLDTEKLRKRRKEYLREFVEKSRDVA